MKSTKKSFLMSLVSLMLCFAMLLGTTYAWFTDEVTSGRNTIKAGNLDVELYHNKSATIAETDENKVKDATNLFTDANGNGIRWEPGVIAYENFMVKNVGNLALKYNMLISAWEYNKLDGHDLTEAIKICVVDGGYTPDSTDPRTEAQGKTFTSFASFSKNDEKLAAGASKTFGIILYWEPTENDNQWNANNGKTVTPLHDGKNELFIEFGVQLVATQDTVESDSFNNLYDKDALNPALTDYVHEKATVSKTKMEITELGDNASVTLTTTADDPVKITASVPKAVALAELNKIIPEAQQGEATDTHLDLNLNVETKEKTTTSVTYDISMDGTVTTTKNGEKTVSYAKITSTDDYSTITMTIGAGLKDVSVTHSENEMTEMDTADQTEGIDENGGYYYNKTTGDLTIKTKSYSPFKVSYTIPTGVAKVKETDEYYESLQAAIDAATSGQTVELLKDVPNGTALSVKSDDNLTIDLGGFTYTSSEKGLTNNGTLTLKNGKLATNNEGLINKGTIGELNCVIEAQHKDAIHNSNGTINKISGGRYIGGMSELSSAEHGLRNEGTVGEISGGYFQANHTAIRSNTATINLISGGIFDHCIIRDDGTILSDQGYYTSILADQYEPESKIIKVTGGVWFDLVFQHSYNLETGDWEEWEETYYDDQYYYFCQNVIDSNCTYVEVTNQVEHYAWDWDTTLAVDETQHQYYYIIISTDGFEDNTKQVEIEGNTYTVTRSGGDPDYSYTATKNAATD